MYRHGGRGTAIAHGRPHNAVQTVVGTPNCCMYADRVCIPVRDASHPIHAFLVVVRVFLQYVLRVLSCGHPWLPRALFRQELDLNTGGLVGAVTSIEGTGQLVTGERKPRPKKNSPTRRRRAPAGKSSRWRPQRQRFTHRSTHSLLPVRVSPFHYHSLYIQHRPCACIVAT